MFIDAATQTGWAVRDAGGGIHWGSFSLSDFRSLGAALLRFDLNLMSVIRQHGVTMLCYESAFVAPARWSKKKNRMTVGTHQDVVRKLFALGAHVDFMGAREKIPCHWELRTTIIKYFLGHVPEGREEQKLACVKMCKLRGWDVRNDDEADALAGLDHLGFMLKHHPASAGPLFSERILANV